MVWSQVDVTKPHLVYIILGGFTTLFMLCSSFIKERMYIGEATVATLCGVIFGPHAADLINPKNWGSTDIVTIEFSRVVLVVQCFAVGVELPKYYMEKHWKSVVYLLLPVMTFGWLIVSVFVWQLIPGFNWVDGLVVAACITATDPVLASSVVGKGKFAERVPKHIRDLLSAESGCNDGMAFPFVYLSLYLVQFDRDAREVSFYFIVYVVLYECIFGCIFGFTVGFIARHGIKYSERKNLIDRESLLVFYFVLSLFCAGAGSILGVDDLLVGFAAGVGFSNDGWFTEKTEESHVSNVIDLLLNLAYFVFLGTIIPWEQYNNGVEGLEVWRLVVLSVLVLLFRRIPIMLALKPLIPDIRTWREALFAGHFGPIGVGAIFVALLARAELQHEEAVPMPELPSPDAPHYHLLYLVWPIVTFMVICSILVHGSSVAVFTLGKRINTLTLTMSYTAAPEDGPTWMNRLPRISSQSRSQARTMSQTSLEEPNEKDGAYLAPPAGFLRRRKDGDGHHKRSGSRASSLASGKRRNKSRNDSMGAGGPISQSAIFPNRESTIDNNVVNIPVPATEHAKTTQHHDSASTDETAQERGLESINLEDLPHRPQSPPQISIFEEGHDLVFENEDGDVLDVRESQHNPHPKHHLELPKPATAATRPGADGSTPNPWSLGGIRRRVSDFYSTEMDKRKHLAEKARRGPARAYQYGNTIIVEDEDGEVVKTYELPNQNDEAEAAGPSTEKPKAAARAGWSTLTSLGSYYGAGNKKKPAEEADADGEEKKIRFTMGDGSRLTKEEFIKQMQDLDAGTRQELVEQSNAPTAVKAVANQDPPTKGQARTPPVPASRQGSEESAPAKSSAQRRGAPTNPGNPHTEGESSTSSDELAETAVERRRRMSVLAAQNEGAGEDVHHEGVEETPAERRRRVAALAGGGEEDSEDEGTERVPPARRGIRFAPEQDRGRR